MSQFRNTRTATSELTADSSLDDVILALEALRLKADAGEALTGEEANNHLIDLSKPIARLGSSQAILCLEWHRRNVSQLINRIVDDDFTRDFGGWMSELLDHLCS
jgi:hypothetical protein